MLTALYSETAREKNHNTNLVIQTREDPIQVVILGLNFIHSIFEQGCTNAIQAYTSGVIV